MNTTHSIENHKQARGFTLIEMVGVLAVIAILAALIVPKIMQAMSDSRFSSTVSTLNACRTATLSYYGQTNAFPVTNNFDNLLVSGGFLDRPFAAKLGTGWAMQCVSTTGGPGGNGYKLDGTVTATTNVTCVIECVLSNVAAADAWELSKRIDGDSLSAADGASADTKGRVEYDVTSGTVFVYLAHK